MKKLLSMVLLVIALSIAILTQPVLAAEPANGAKIFSANCAACHIGGTNVIIAQKTLKQEALEKFLENYNHDSLQAIIHQVQNGKNAMPAFKGRLTDTEIEDVASYVLEQSQQGWQNGKDTTESE